MPNLSPFPVLEEKRGEGGKRKKEEKETDRVSRRKKKRWEEERHIPFTQLTLPQKGGRGGGEEGGKLLVSLTVTGNR